MQRRFDIGNMRLYYKDGSLYIATKNLNAPNYGDSNLKGYTITAIFSQ